MPPPSGLSPATQALIEQYFADSTAAAAADAADAQAVQSLQSATAVEAAAKADSLAKHKQAVADATAALSAVANELGLGQQPEPIPPPQPTVPTALTPPRPPLPMS